VSSFFSPTTSTFCLLLTLIGWLCAITWQTGVAGSAYVAGTMIQGLFVLNIETYHYQRWHGSLLTLALLLITVIFNTFLARKLPIVEGLFVILHILGIIIFIPLWILGPKREGGAPLVEFYNGGGWASNGLSTMIGTVAPAAALIGFDCSVHMGILSLDFLSTFSYLSYS
jgi:Amino acid permease